MKNRELALSLLPVVAIFWFSSVAAFEHVLVKTRNGDILGRVLRRVPNITKVNQFTGIPFASPPVGELRFKAPRPAQPWHPRVLNATHFGNLCMQFPGGQIESFVKAVWPSFTKDNYSEDCLYLNVYAPAQKDSFNPTEHYPVMVYIHGGGFLTGTSLLSDGLVLAQYGVVLVTIQYRLGPFGFMTTGDSTAPGNYGMLDQVLALKWVSENIKNFGGDSNKVTIFGLSAGGASVGLHLLSPLSKSYIHGAISESGVDLSPWSVTKTDVAVANTIKVAQELGCKSTEYHKMVKCLRSKDAWSFVKLSLFTKGSMVIPWAPVVDKLAGNNAFLPDEPQSLRRTGKFNKVPFMIGFMFNDGALFLDHLTNKTIDLQSFKDAMKNYSIGIWNSKKEDLVRMMQNALEFQYTPWGETAVSSKLRQGIADVMTDVWFSAPSVSSCLLHSDHAPAYLFVFNYRSKFAFSQKWMGVTHSDNFIFDFGIPLLSDVPILPSYDAVDKNISKLVMTMYSNFAKSGNPTPEPLPNGVQWAAFNSTNLAYLRIQPYPEMKSNFMPHRMAFWNEYRPSLMKSLPRCNTTDEKPVNGGVRGIFSFTAMIFFISGAISFMLA